MDYPAKTYALELETAFRKLLPNLSPSADAFETCPAEAFEEGLSYLAANSVIKSEEIPSLLFEYDFGNVPLNAYLEANGTEKIEDLIGQVNAWADKESKLEN